jgi:hypothetical protein
MRGDWPPVAAAGNDGQFIFSIFFSPNRDPFDWWATIYFSRRERAAGFFLQGDRPAVAVI